MLISEPPFMRIESLNLGVLELIAHKLQDSKDSKASGPEDFFEAVDVGRRVLS
jgi:hypothetical protein